VKFGAGPNGKAAPLTGNRTQSQFGQTDRTADDADERGQEIAQIGGDLPTDGDIGGMTIGDHSDEMEDSDESKDNFEEGDDDSEAGETREYLQDWVRHQTPVVRAKLP
jgi:hypothetical protein